jgi:hypothetical protein
VRKQVTGEALWSLKVLSGMEEPLYPDESEQSGSF